MKKIKQLFELFCIMFKIGLFTFGGGYAMVGIMENELVERKKLIEHEEFLDLLAIAESTPGPIAINSATYIGYKLVGVWGSIFATLAVSLPSFIIIYIISLFFYEFLSLEIVNYAFKGIQVAVSYLILSAGIKMFKKLKKSILVYTLMPFTLITFILLTLFAKSFSSIYFILIGGATGLIAFSITQLIKNKKESNENDIS